MNRFVTAILVFALLFPAPFFAQSTPPKKQSTKKPVAKSAPKTTSSKAAQARARAKARAAALEAARVRRMNETFVASADLKPMAVQLVQTRSKAAFAGVEKYARKHEGSDPAALAWLVTGFARIQEGDYTKAVIALKNAKPNARELGDYVDFLLATAYRSTNSPKDVILALDGFEKRYPESLFLRDSALIRANALITTSAPDVAIELLEAQRDPMRPDIELTLGRAYAITGKNDKAIESLRRVYYEMPMSGEADEAGSRLRQLVAKGQFGTPEMRRQRADLLTKGKRYWQAISEYRQLTTEPEGKSDPDLKVALANALYKSNNISEARNVLEEVGGVQSQDDANAQRLYLLAEIARSAKDEDAQLRAVADLRAASPKSLWLQEALMSLGNRYLLHNDFANAAAIYDEVGHSFPTGKFGSVAHWKSAWLNYRMGKMDDAQRQFDEQIAMFPASLEVPNALYWRGRIAEQQGDLTKARSCYQKLSERFRNYYYATLARERLRVIKLEPVVDDPTFARIPPPSDPQSLYESSEGVTDIRLQKARLLGNAGMNDQAIKELEAASKSGNRWALGEMVKLQQDTSRPYTALQTLKKAIPSYFAVDTSRIPREFLVALFPRPFWTDLKTNASANSLDPYLVASLIRQESEFNPSAISHANAYGLMQLLPSVGKKVAKEVKLRPYSTSKLLDPSANLKLGTHYFRQMIDENGGSVEYALAAYNAGSNRVSDWRAAGQYRDMAEFVESIPFTETREYVQAIVRNMEVYKRVYGNTP